MIYVHFEYLDGGRGEGGTDSERFRKFSVGSIPGGRSGKFAMKTAHYLY